MAQSLLRTRSIFIWFTSFVFVLAILYYVFAFFGKIASVTTVEETEGVNLAQNPLKVNLTNNPKALDKLEEFKQTDFVNLRPKQQDKLLHEYIPLIGVNGILDVLEQDAHNRHEKCHNQAHIVGIAATWVTEDLDYLMEVVQNRCDSAAFHGVVEAKLASFQSGSNSNKDLKDLAPAIVSICSNKQVAKLFGTGSFDFFHFLVCKIGFKGECANTIGFAFLMMDPSYTKAVNACFQISSYRGLLQANQKATNWAFYCAEGAFKNFLYNHCDCSSSLEPCFSNTTVPGACWSFKFMTMGMNKEENINKDTKFSICKSLSIEKQPSCYYGIGSFLSSIFDYKNITLCLQKDISLESQMACVDGFVSRITERRGSYKAEEICDVLSNKGDDIFGICKNVSTSGPYDMTKDVSNYI